MFKRIRVLVVDDSAFMRKIISDMINSQLDMEVVDTARDGDYAIAKSKINDIDIITMDIEMPNKNGIEALIEIKKISKCEIIMLSSLTSIGSETTIEALRLGAFDFIQKPSGSISLDIEKIKEELLEKIRYASHYKQIKGKFQSPPIHIFNNKELPQKINAVVVGASTGGPKIIYDIITNLPGNLDIPIFIVQHMPKGFTNSFAERINKFSNLKVIEATEGIKVEKNNVYIAPGGFHMTIINGFIKLDLSPSIHGVRPAIDKLFFSASKEYKENLLSCILTRMGKDGADGIIQIKKSGGYVLAQNEETCTVYGMPKVAFQTGCVDEVLPDNKIAQRIIQIVKKVW